MDIGGRNSLNNFASSYARAQSFVGSNLGENALVDEISPCTLRAQEDSMVRSHSASGNITTSEGSTLDGSSGRHGNHLNDFHFTHEETTPLLGHRKHRTSSFASELVIFENDSTAPQTIFNAVNTLMGIAMLSLAFGFRLSGWVLGTVLLSVSAWTTTYTAKVLGTILKKNQGLNTYGDIAFLFGGKKFQALATCIFVVDLMGASVLLVLLFSDSFTILFPEVGAATFKTLLVIITFLLSFLPLAMISLVSLTGILSTVALLLLITACGFLTFESPGSLLSPTSTYLWPKSFTNVLLSLGVFMAPWGGHPVFPELYRDMRHPNKFGRCCNITFITTFLFDLFIGCVGFLMFGKDCEDSLTKNIMVNKNYPSWVNPLFCTFLGILPVSKLALVIRPIISVYESHFGMNQLLIITYENGKRVNKMTLPKFAARLGLAGLLLAISLSFTSFGKVIAFLGSAICFTICVTFPLMFHLKLNSDDLTPFLRALTIFGIVCGFSGAIIGTYASFAFSPL